MKKTIELKNKNGLLVLPSSEVSASYKFDLVASGLTLEEADEDRVLIHYYDGGDVDTFAGEFDKDNMLNLQNLHDALFNLREMGVIHRSVGYAKLPSSHVCHPISF